MSQVHICEVGPRDGLQNAHHLMPTEAKKAWIAALAAAGLKEIEVGSFVPPKLIPAMADTGEIVRYSLGIKNLKVVALAPNLKGFQRALEAGAHKVTFPVSASRKHSESNVRMTPEQMIEEVRKCAQLAASGRGDRRRGVDRVRLHDAGRGAGGRRRAHRGGARRVLRLRGARRHGRLCKSGADQEDLFTKVRKQIGDKLEAAHLHNTRGLGLANALAAYEEGVRHFDSSMGGLGGCPFAPGASGNVITEDLVFMFESMGIATGIDLPKLFAAREVLIKAIAGRADLRPHPRSRPAKRISCCRLRVCASSSSRTW